MAKISFPDPMAILWGVAFGLLAIWVANRVPQIGSVVK